MSDGSVYISGYRKLVQRDAKTGDLRTWSIDSDLRALCEGANGELWLGTTAGNLVRLAGETLENVPGGAFGYPVVGLARGSGAAFWVATRGAGLFRWDAGKVEHWTMAQGLPTNLLQALVPDADGTLWIGTAGGGLAWLDQGTSRAKSIGPRQGLGDGTVSQMLDDGRGNLWLAGIRGIRRVSKTELRAVADAKAAAVHPLMLDENDGMTTAECTGGYSPAGLFARSGIMYFSTLRDLVAIDSAAFDPAPSPPPVIIETVRCDGKPVSPSGGALTLPPGSSELEIRYTGFDGAKPEQLRFRHRLHHDRDWEYVEGARDVRYAALRPGAYEFELSAAKADGHWLEPAARLSITVQPYFWQMTRFRVAVAIGLFAGGAGFVAVVLRHKDRLHRAELARQRALAEAEREIAKQRDELAHLSRVTMLGELSGSIAHELNQPLTAILSNAQAALLMIDTPVGMTEVREILQDIVDADKRAGEVIRRLRLLFTKGQTVYQRLAPAEVIHDVLRLMRNDLVSHGVVVRETIADNVPPVRGDRVQLQQVMINLVMNACHAMAAVSTADRQLTIRAQRGPDGEQGVLVSVTDRGPGIAPDRLEQVFEPFVTTKSTGMGLGLAVCRTIVTAHGGRLWAEGADGTGATFFLSLPADAAVGVES
jgi:signal transduction histidine kinase